MTAVDIAALRALVNAANPEEWRARQHGLDGLSYISARAPYFPDDIADRVYWEDAKAIVGLKNAAPELLRLAEIGQRVTWQPIETAQPGARVLLCRAGEDPWMGAADMGWMPAPTHWMPVPAPMVRGDGE